MKIDDNKIQTENIFESSQEQTSVEPDTIPTETTHLYTLKFSESSFSEIFTRQLQNLSKETQQQFSEVFSLEQAQAENDRLRLQHQQRIEAAIQILRRQELQLNQLLQQLNQSDTEIQKKNVISENTKMIPTTTSERVPPQQFARSKFSSPPRIVFHVITEGQKVLTLRMLLVLLKTLILF